MTATSNLSQIPADAEACRTLRLQRPDLRPARYEKVNSMYKGPFVAILIAAMGVLNLVYAVKSAADGDGPAFGFFLLAMFFFAFAWFSYRRSR